MGFVSYGGNGHPSIPSFFSDSVNLEASWLALFGVFFNRDRVGLLYLIGSLSISALYASRVGIILSLLSIAYVLFVKSKDRIGVSKLVGIAVLIAGLIAVAQIAGLPIMDRFLAIGEDKGSTGENGHVAIRIKCLYRRSFVRKWCRKRRCSLENGQWNAFL